MVEGAKPIEAGCDALLLSANNHPELAGKIYEVLGRVPEGLGFPNEWDIDCRVNGQQICAPEYHLMRIDDPEINEQIEEELEVVV